MRVIKDFDKLMTELRAEFSNGKVFQAEISSDGELVEGLYEPSTGAVYVTPCRTSWTRCCTSCSTVAIPDGVKPG